MAEDIEEARIMSNLPHQVEQDVITLRESNRQGRRQICNKATNRWQIPSTVGMWPNPGDSTNRSPRNAGGVLLVVETHQSGVAGHPPMPRLQARPNTVAAEIVGRSVASLKPLPETRPISAADAELR